MPESSWEFDMEITVGTFNLNNLFSRFNFEAKVDDIPEAERDVREIDGPPP